MTREQKMLWKEIQQIQNYVVNVFLLKKSEYDKEEDFLNDVTYETICEIMELFDGYKNPDLYAEIISKTSGMSINSNIELHDYCEKYLNCSEI